MLGDSYSAGNGADNYYGPRGCFRSTRNWAEKYLDTLRSSRNVTFINRACSGGVLANVSGERKHEDELVTVYLPQEDVDKDDPRARAKLDDLEACTTPYRDDEAYRIEAMSARSAIGRTGTEVVFRCTRYMEPQWDAVGKDTDLVLFTIGGNDVNFGEIIKACFVVFARDPGRCRDNINEGHEAVEDVGRNTTADFLQDLKRRCDPMPRSWSSRTPTLRRTPTSNYATASCSATSIRRS